MNAENTINAEAGRRCPQRVAWACATPAVAATTRRAEDNAVLPSRNHRSTLLQFALIRFLVVVIAILVPVSSGNAQTREETELKLKAAFVLKFALYVEWPESAFASPTNAIVFGVLGRDPFGKNFDATMQGQTVDKHPVVVKRGRTLAELGDCHVIFVSASERDRLRIQLPSLQDKPVLTISDVEGFTISGGMIGLKRKPGAIRFDINRHAAEAASLKISSRLLKLAEEVR